MVRSRKSQSGFTIVELMISTMIFSFVLLVCAVAIVHVGRMYFKGVITSRTQDSSRRLGEDVAQAIQFGVSSDGTNFIRPGTPIPYSGVNVRSWCIGEIRYSYSVDQAMGVGNARHIVWKDRVAVDDAVCTPQNLTLTTPSAGGEEMLGDKMRIPVFNVNELAGAAAVTQVDIKVAYGDTSDLFQPAPAPPFEQCKGVNASGQFCSTAAFNTLVTKRL